MDPQATQLLRNELQFEHRELFKVYPELQTQEEPLKLKDPAVLQVVHTDLEEQVRHPTMKDEQVEQVVTSITYPLWQLAQAVVDEHVAQVDRKAVHGAQILLFRA